MSDAEYLTEYCTSTTETVEAPSPYAPLLDELQATLDALAAKYRQLSAQQAAHSQRFLQKMQGLYELYGGTPPWPDLAKRPVHPTHQGDHPLITQAILAECFDDTDIRLLTQMSKLNVEMIKKMIEIENIRREEKRYMEDQREMQQREEQWAWASQLEEKNQFVRAWIENNAVVEVEGDESEEDGE
ncbi:hypothetical protein FRC07_005556, partial [Ceratobasidium sp. 392]